MARYLCDIYTIAFSRPYITHFTYWGGGFFDEKGQPTLFYQELYRLIRREWSTQYTGITDQEGILRFSGFKGTYTFSLPEGQVIGSAVL